MKKNGILMQNIPAIGVFAAIIMFGVVGTMDFEDEQAQQGYYCEMVKLWVQTDGQAGWPAYRGGCK